MWKEANDINQYHTKTHTLIISSIKGGLLEHNNEEKVKWNSYLDMIH